MAHGIHTIFGQHKAAKPETTVACHLQQPLLLVYPLRTILSGIECQTNPTGKSKRFTLIRYPLM